MATLANSIGVAYQCNVFATLETTKGTLAFPTPATDLVIAADLPDMQQLPAFVNSNEVLYTRDILNKFQNMTPAGSFTLPIYLRPSGAAGSPPMGDALFQSWFGKKNTVASTSVTYQQQVIKPSFTLWFQRGHTVFAAAGAVIDAGKISFTNKGGVLLNLSGQFLQMYYAGTAQVMTAAAQAATSVTLKAGEGKKYTAGMYIQNVTQSDTNASAGYKVSAVNGDVLTLATGITKAGGWLVDDAIAGFLPTGTAIGAPLEFRKAAFTVLGTTRNVKQLDFSYADKIKVLDDEITSTGYPQDYIEDQRLIDGTMKCYFRRNDTQLFTDGFANNNKGALQIVIGTVPGKIATLNMPNAMFEVPNVNNNKPAIEFDLKFTALASSGNGEDSCTLAFT